jgi:hypothetical protein
MHCQLPLSFLTASLQFVYTTGVPTAQLIDPDVQNWLRKNPVSPTKTSTVSSFSVDQWKIVIREALVLDTITWYHHTMGHAGSSRL